MNSKSSTNLRYPLGLLGFLKAPVLVVSSGEEGNIG